MDENIPASISGGICVTETHNVIRDSTGAVAASDHSLYEPKGRRVPLARSAHAQKPVDDAAESSRDYIEMTRAHWQPHYTEALSREDARQMAHNLVGFFKLVRSWKVAERRAIYEAEKERLALTSSQESKTT